MFCGVWIVISFAAFSLMAAHAHQVLELESNTFEVTVTAYQYLAVLFYDFSDQGKHLGHIWEEAANELGDRLPDDVQMAKIAANSAELKEIVDAYGISVPTVLVFRKGVVDSFRGSLHHSREIAAYILEDSKPSIALLRTLDEIKATLRDSSSAVVIGFFREDEIDLGQTADSETDDINFSDNWLQYQTSADTLRGQMRFYTATSKQLLESFSIQEQDLPAIYLFSEESEGLARYSGPLVDTALTDWLLRHVSPAMDELSLSSPASQQYATHFFSSKKTKFILCLPGSADDVSNDDAVSTWTRFAQKYRGKAIFSYMFTANPIVDVIDYFEVDVKKDLPCIVAHHPGHDHRYKSWPLRGQHLHRDSYRFVDGVLTGRIPKIARSEAIPKTQRLMVHKVVGKNVQEVVSHPHKDVVLAVYASHQPASKGLLPLLEMLAKAVQSESRIQIVKLDASLNDLPSSWGVKNYPALLWFPAKDKPYEGTGGGLADDVEEGDEEEEDNGNRPSPVPRPRAYWDAGYSLVEMVTFVMRESSFEKSTLRIATSEQLSTLQQDEDVYRQKCDEEDRYERRNEGRDVYEDERVDYVLGEVVFDGKRWHVLAVGVLAVWAVLTTLLLLLLSASSSTSKKVKRQ